MRQAFSILLIAMVCIGCESSIPSDNTTTKGIGVFSVSETKKVTFSPSNLYYDRETSSWNFFEEQWNALTITNLNSPVGINGRWFSTLADVAYPESIDTQVQLGKKIDLFGWGTGDNPMLLSEILADYANFYDWGFNKIGNDRSKKWRTLHYDEWDYLLHKRSNADSLLHYMSIAGIDGLMLLPDGWTCPSGVKLKQWPEEAVIPIDIPTYSLEEWRVLEKSGAVFMNANCTMRNVAKGWLSLSDLYETRYWVASHSNDSTGVAISIGPLWKVKFTDEPRSNGYAVRLVKDIK